MATAQTQLQILALALIGSFAASSAFGDSARGRRSSQEALLRGGADAAIVRGANRGLLQATGGLPPGSALDILAWSYYNSHYNLANGISPVWVTPAIEGLALFCPPEANTPSAPRSVCHSFCLDEHWTDASANAFCRDKGFSGGRTGAPILSKYVPLLNITWFGAAQVRCPPGASSMAACSMLLGAGGGQLANGTWLCSTGEHATVSCYGDAADVKRVPTDTSAGDSVYLISISPPRGIPRVCPAGGTPDQPRCTLICADWGWTDEAASAWCQDLGYISGRAYPASSNFAPEQFGIAQIRCPPGASSLSNCTGLVVPDVGLPTATGKLSDGSYACASGIPATLACSSVRRATPSPSPPPTTVPPSPSPSVVAPSSPAPSSPTGVRPSPSPTPTTIPPTNTTTNATSTTNGTTTTTTTANTTTPLILNSTNSISVNSTFYISYSNGDEWLDNTWQGVAFFCPPEAAAAAAVRGSTEPECLVFCQDAHWNDTEAGAFCRSAGFSGGVAVPSGLYLTEAKWFGAAEVHCPPDAASILGCSMLRTSRGGQLRNGSLACPDSRPAAVSCHGVLEGAALPPWVTLEVLPTTDEDEAHPLKSTHQGVARLHNLDGDSDSNHTSYICDDGSWDDNAARAYCLDAGYAAGGVRLPGEQLVYPDSPRMIHVAQIRCSPNATSLARNCTMTLGAAVRGRLDPAHAGLCPSGLAARVRCEEPLNDGSSLSLKLLAVSIGGAAAAYLVTLAAAALILRHKRDRVVPTELSAHPGGKAAAPAFGTPAVSVSVAVAEGTVGSDYHDPTTTLPELWMVYPIWLKFPHHIGISAKVAEQVALFVYSVLSGALYFGIMWDHLDERNDLSCHICVLLPGVVVAFINLFACCMTALVVVIALAKWPKPMRHWHAFDVHMCQLLIDMVTKLMNPFRFVITLLIFVVGVVLLVAVVGAEHLSELDWTMLASTVVVFVLGKPWGYIRVNNAEGLMPVDKWNSIADSTFPEFFIRHADAPSGKHQYESLGHLFNTTAQATTRVLPLNGYPGIGSSLHGDSINTENLVQKATGYF